MNIKKLRAKISNYHSFLISESLCLFGSPFGDVTTVTASTPKHALEKYWRQYHRKYKEKHAYVGCSLETTSNWGKFKITDLNTGYKTYYR